MVVRVLACVLALAACSYTFIDRAPRAVRPGDTFPACTEDNTYPHLDVAGAVLAVVGAVGIYTGVAKADTDDPMVKRELTPAERMVGGSAALVEAVLFYLSARHGLAQTEACRELHARIVAGAPR